MDGAADRGAQLAELATVRDEIRFELELLHQRTNALLAAEAFLTIAYTAALSNGAPWGRAFAVVAGPVLAVLGLLLALLAWPGVQTTARIVLDATRHLDRLVADLSDASGAGARTSGYRLATSADQRRSLRFFRAVPPLFCLVWATLVVLALVVLS